MDAGIIAVIVTVGTTGVIISASVLIALFVVIRQSNRLEEQMQASVSELRNEIRDLANRFSTVESNQARLEGANNIMQAQAHTHAPSTSTFDD